METNLTEIESRVLGSLIEKELATPESYPLTLHSLTAACNQKSNRHPVMNLHEAEVIRTLDSLKFKHLVLTAADAGRVPKYRHLLYEKLKLEPAELAVMAENERFSALEEVRLLREEVAKLRKELEEFKAQFE